jgi:hypothetical protein
MIAVCIAFPRISLSVACSTPAEILMGALSLFALHFYVFHCRQPAPHLALWAACSTPEEILMGALSLFIFHFHVFQGTGVGACVAAAASAPLKSSADSERMPCYKLICCWTSCCRAVLSDASGQGTLHYPTSRTIKACDGINCKIKSV